MVRQRGNGQQESAKEAYQWGLDHDFANAEVKWHVEKPATFGPKLTKAGLIEAIQDYPDDTPIVVAAARGREDIYRYLTLGSYDNQPVVWSVSSNPDRIVLEL